MRIRKCHGTCAVALNELERGWKQVRTRIVLVASRAVDCIHSGTSLVSQQARPTEWSGPVGIVASVRAMTRAAGDYMGVASVKRRFTSSQLMRLKKAAT